MKRRKQKVKKQQQKRNDTIALPSDIVPERFILAEMVDIRWIRGWEHMDETERKSEALRHGGYSSYGLDLENKVVLRPIGDAGSIFLVAVKQ